MNRLAGKVTVVTGGGSGSGRATCELCAEQRAAVVVAEIDPAGGEETARRIVARGGRATFIPTTVADESRVAAMAPRRWMNMGP